jgi:septal ring factor EnvC (AmiA/AmiB activator)
MAREVKFTEDEMSNIKELQQTYVAVQNSFGQLGVQRLRLNQQISELDKVEEQITSKFAETQTNERAFVATINKKYGDGNLDLESGVFTAAPAKAETPVVGAPSAASAVKTDKTL